MTNLEPTGELPDVSVVKAETSIGRHRCASWSNRSRSAKEHGSRDRPASHVRGLRNKQDSMVDIDCRHRLHRDVDHAWLNPRRKQPVLAIVGSLGASDSAPEIPVDLGRIGRLEIESR